MMKMLPYYKIKVICETEKGNKKCVYNQENLTKQEAKTNIEKIARTIDKNMLNDNEIERSLIYLKKNETEIRFQNKKTKNLYCKYFVKMERYSLLQLLNIK
ncbi:hypothetical protein HCJ47_11230 [Listeria sp. FSL L7-1558]|nr:MULTISPECIES: hypothetical protein [Listeria]MBC1483981.1 hypothetical protein [Listeria immobilis]MBC1839597.1 hypothetical protein [Listeria seeligeri]MBC6304257.1 hypothetical protein [Listeria immobilis]